MDMIDADWINARLTGRHGEKTRLAVALRISKDKVTKILKGTRDVQLEEVPRLLEFFGITLSEDSGDHTRQELLGKLKRLNEAGQALLEKHLKSLLETPELLRDDESMQEEASPGRQT